MAASNPSTQDLLKELLLKTRQSPFSELEEELSCTICTQPFITGDSPELPITLPCGHHFGSACILKWLSPTSEHGNNSCPKCRAPIFDDWNAQDSQSEDEAFDEWTAAIEGYERAIDVTEPGTEARIQANRAAIQGLHTMLPREVMESLGEQLERGVEETAVGTEEREDAEQFRNLMLMLEPVPTELLGRILISM